MSKLLLIRSVRPNPRDNFSRLEFIGEIDGITVTFDPFVSCHLEWYQASKWIGKDVRFLGESSESGVVLMSELLEVL